MPPALDPRPDRLHRRDVREHCAARLLQLVADAGVVAAAEAGAKATGKKGKADADSRKHSNAAQEEAQRGAVRRALEIVKAAAPGAVPAALEDASGGEAGERQAKDEIAGALSALDRARKAAEKGGDDPRSVALGRLAEVLALYVMAVPDKVDLGIAEDVGAVAERLGGGEKKGKGKKGEAGAEEPHWSEVLVDLILALLSGSFKPVPGAVLRGVLEGAFSACAGDMTRAALESMTAVLSRPLSGGEEEDEEEMEMEVDEVSVVVNKPLGGGVAQEGLCGSHSHEGIGHESRAPWGC